MAERQTSHNVWRSPRFWAVAGAGAGLLVAVAVRSSSSDSGPPTTISMDQPPRPDMKRTNCSPYVLPPEETSHVSVGPIPESVNQKSRRAMQELGAKVLDLANICPTPGTTLPDRTVARTSWQAPNGDSEVVTEVVLRDGSEPRRYNFQVDVKGEDRVIGVSLFVGSPTQPPEKRQRWSLSEPYIDTFVLDYTDSQQHRILGHPMTGVHDATGPLDAGQLDALVAYADSLIDAAE